MIDEKEVLKILKRYECRMSSTAYISLLSDISNIEKAETLFCEECGIIETQPMFMQKHCRYCGAKLKGAKL